MNRGKSTHFSSLLKIARRPAIIAVSLLLMFCLGALTFNAYYSRSVALKFADITAEDVTIDADNVFRASFLCELSGKNISKYKYTVEDKTLYITLYAKAGDKDVLPSDENGYVAVSFDVGCDIEKIYYRNGDVKSLLPFENEQGA